MSVPDLSLLWRLIRSCGIGPFLDHFFISGRNGKEVTPQSDTIDRADRRHPLMQAGRLSSDTGERKYKAFLTITGAPFVLMYCVCLPASGGVLAVSEIRGAEVLDSSAQCGDGSWMPGSMNC